MTSEVTHPGVFVEELPSAVHSIPGVPTSITAFMGRAERGPSINDDARPDTIFSFTEYERIFGGLWTHSPMSYAVRDFFLNGGNQAVIVRLFEVSQDPNALPCGDSLTALPADGCAVISADAPPAPIEGAESAADSPSIPKAPSVHLPLRAANPGSWGNWIRVMVDTNGIGPDVAQVCADYGVPLADLFNLTVFCSSPGGRMQTERFVNLTLADYAGFPTYPNRVDRVVNQQSQFVRVFADRLTPQADSTWLEAWIAFGSSPNLPAREQELFAMLSAAGGGDDGRVIQSETTYDDPTQGGLAALDRVDLFNLLCVPYDPTVPGAEAAAMQAYPALAHYCQKRRAMFIVDPPSSWAGFAEKSDWASIQPTDLKIEGDPARNAAVYFPRVVEADPLLEGQPRVMPACGIIAGIIAGADAGRGIWKAPAGIGATLNGTLNLEFNLTDDQNGMLNPLGINCLRNFPVIGQVVWGARTLRGADQLQDDYKYIPVRRLALYIEESLYRGTKWAVFEPNAEPLWAMLRNTINAFLSGLQRQGAFYSYFVTCDSSTTTMDDIGRGRVNITIGIAPLKPAEFVVIQIQQMTGQTSS